MRIDTPEGAYRIIRVIKKELSVCFYLAGNWERTGEDGGGQRYLLLEFRNPVLAKEKMPHFMEMKAEKNCPDFADCFIREGTLWAVFRCREGVPFDEAAAYGMRTPAEKEEDKKGGEKGILLGIWEFLFGHAGTILKCGYWMLVLALWGLFFALCFCPKTAPKERNRIFMIGTVEVEERGTERDGEEP